MEFIFFFPFNYYYYYYVACFQSGNISVRLHKKILLDRFVFVFHYLIVYSSNNVIIAFNKNCLT